MLINDGKLKRRVSRSKKRQKIIFFTYFELKIIINYNFITTFGTSTFFPNLYWFCLNNFWMVNPSSNFGSRWLNGKLNSEKRSFGPYFPQNKGGHINRLVAYQINLVGLKRQFKFRTERHSFAYLKV